MQLALASDITVDQDLTVVRDVNIGRNAVVSGNLTVAGTASFQNTTNLDVADRFIRMASGSTASWRWWYYRTTESCWRRRIW